MLVLEIIGIPQILFNFSKDNMFKITSNHIIMYLKHTNDETTIAYARDSIDAGKIISSMKTVYPDVFISEVTVPDDFDNFTWRNKGLDDARKPSLN